MEDDDENIVKIIVGGVKFMTNKSTLQTFPCTTLSELDPSSKYYKMKLNCYFFDRNPIVFHHVLECYRTGKLHLSANVCYQAVIEELEFWKLDIGTVLSSCCLGPFQDYEEKRDVLQKVYNETVEECMRDGKVMKKIETAEGARLWRYKLWMFLERPNSSKPALMWALFQIALVYVCMVIYAMMTTVPAIMIGEVKNNTAAKVNGTRRGLQELTALEVFSIADTVINIIFTLELLVRLAIAPDRLKLLKMITTIVDVFCNITYWIYAVFSAVDFADGVPGPKAIVARNIVFVIQVFRLIKVTKLSSKYVQLRSLLLSIKYSLKEILIINLCFSAVMFLFAVIVYYAEYGTVDTQLYDIPIAFWWALITMTTVGYGDTVPTTAAGHIIAGLCACTGVLLTGLAISILGNNLQTYSRLTGQQQRAQKMVDKRIKSRPQGASGYHAYIYEIGFTQGTDSKAKTTEKDDKTTKQITAEIVIKEDNTKEETNVTAAE